MEQIIYRMM